MGQTGRRQVDCSRVAGKCPNLHESTPCTLMHALATVRFLCKVSYSLVNSDYPALVSSIGPTIMTAKQAVISVSFVHSVAVML